MPLTAVRHAETVWNRERVFMGALDVAPTADGFARAARAAGALGTSAYDYASTPSWAWSHLRTGAPG